MIESILKDVFEKFTRDEAETRRKEKERQDKAEATRFRTYNLQLKYFYRWKQNARERRLRQLRKSGREQFKAFREAQRASRLREEEEVAQKIAQQQQEEVARVNRSKEMANVLRKSVRHRQMTEDALLASGVLSGIQNEREAIAKIVRKEPSSSQMLPVNGDHRARSRSGSIASTASVLGGSKTRALREELLGNKTERFRRSLPSFSPDGRSTPERTPQASKVSERWRLKAMGIVQMPDGTALPETMINEIRHGMREDRSISSRRPSIASTVQNNYYPPPSLSPRRIEGPQATAQKRKRPIQDDSPGQAPKAGDGSSVTEGCKGVLSEAENLIRELRAMRQEMEEGTTWFKAQNGRLQSEAMSRDGSVI
ncbi:hypothetical protein ESCO_000425 [Escovopsis weberi]|uniref:Uncharacterized protein n=1 Tax=Escovopsis weberi TaxID=150374 RepID=A0A0M8N2P0_ESCWE|nr:hypothetical protein ESCO_000425 [Escovopsis weberi]